MYLERLEEEEGEKTEFFAGEEMNLSSFSSLFQGSREKEARCDAGSAGITNICECLLSFGAARLFVYAEPNRTEPS